MSQRPFALALLGLLVTTSGLRAASRVVWFETETHRIKTLMEGEQVVQVWHFALKPPGSEELEDAVEAGEGEMVRLLLEAGVPPEGRQPDGTTLLHRAARRGWRDICRLLLEHGAAAGLADEWGVTALDLAEHHGHRDVARLLEQWGAGRGTGNVEHHVDEEEDYGC